MSDRLVYILARMVVGMLRRMPLGICFLLGRGIGLSLWVLLPGYRSLARQNIFAAYRGDLTASEAGALTREHFATMGANAACAFKVPALSQEEILRIAPIEGLFRIKENIARGKPVVLAINHIGNWELYAQLVFQVPEARFGTVYQSLRNSLLDGLVNSDRRRLGVATFDRKKGFNAAIALLREPGVLGVLVDQSAGNGGMWTPFFNRLSSTSTLAATLAMRTGAAVIPVAIQTAGFARWKVILEEEIPWNASNPGQLTADINAVLERQIRRSPADWFWVHNRWKGPWPNFLVATQRRGIYLPPRTDASRLHPFRIVARSPNWLGDAVMSANAVRALRAGRPDARLTVLTPSKLAAFWRAVPGIDHVVEIPAGASVFSVAGVLRGKFDVAVLFPNSLRSALEVWLAGIPRRIGYPGNRRAMLLTNPLRQKPSKRVPRPMHHADRYWEIAERCGATPLQPVPSRWSPSPGIPVLGICPGAEFGPAKRWPAARFRDVMEKVSSSMECRWLIFGTAGDRAVADEICAGFPGKVQNLAGTTSMEQLVERLIPVHALLTNDTGTMHLADFLGVPLVAVFGSTEPRLTGPRNSRSVVLRQHVECSPCFLRECPLDFRCMKAVTTDQAVSALLGLIRDAPATIVPPPPFNTGGYPR